jgi:transcriptional regulator MraZ
VEEKGTNVADLLGQHRYQLDAKGRIALPAKFRDAFGEGIYLTLGQEGCLYAFPRAEWDRRAGETHARPLTDPEARHYARMFFSSADRVDLDGQGRLVIPQKLRAETGLSREAVVVGMYDRLEIWASDAWDRYESSHRDAYLSGTLHPQT